MKTKRRIPIKFKVFGLVAFLVFFALAMILFQTSRIFKADKADFVKEMSAKLASSAAKNIADKVANIQDKLVVFIQTKESLNRTKARVQDQNQVLFLRYQEYLSIGFLIENESGQLTQEWILRNPNADSQKWTSDFEKTFLSQLNVVPAKQSKRWFWKTQAPDGQWLSVLGFSVEIVDKKKEKKQNKKDPANLETTNAWIVAFMPAKLMQNLISDFETGINTGMIVDNEGVAVAASDTKLRLRNLSGHPVVAEVLKKNRPAGTGDYVDLEDKAIIGSFENIPSLNLGIVVTTPKEKAFEAARVLVRNILFIGIMVLIVAIATAIILSNYMTKPLQRLAKIAAQIGAGDFTIPVEAETNDEIGDLANSFAVMEKGLIERDEKLDHSKQALVQSEKMSAFGQLSAGIAHEVKNPLAGILGHAQLAMSKIQNEDVKKHLEVIEKETRRCKSIVENLMKFARAEKIELQPTDLAQVAQDTVNLVEHQLSLAGCKIYKDFQPCPMVMANGNQLQQVLLNLMVNSSHAMENSAKKNVILHVKQVGQKAQIQVEDTGAGIPPDIQKKIFEPFFTTKPAGKGTGLGLSVSIGIVKDHKGEIYLKSEINQGTSFFIDIPIPEGARMSDKALENTHGGTFLTADSKTLAENMAHEKKIAEATALKPTTLSEEVTKSAKNIDVELNAFDARKVAGAKADPVKTEIKKAESAKGELTKTEIPKTQIPKVNIPKVDLSKTTQVKAPEVKPEAKKEQAKTENKKTEIKSKPLAGIPKVEMNLPKKNNEPVAKAPELKLVKDAKEPEKTKTEITNPEITKTNATKKDDGGFKVSIKRPKIK